MPATIYDVARRAGVSIATVSRVLRRSAPVQDETRQRVEDAVEQLGFVPSRLGVSLAVLQPGCGRAGGPAPAGQGGVHRRRLT